jgi:hypothetical protein
MAGMSWTIFTQRFGVQIEDCRLKTGHISCNLQFQICNLPDSLNLPAVQHLVKRCKEPSLSEVLKFLLPKSTLLTSLEADGANRVSQVEYG